MDNVTHALAGCLLAAAAVALVEQRMPVQASIDAAAAPSRPTAVPGFRRTVTLIGILCAELPDADVFYAGPMLGMGKLGSLLHHRGHTHTVLFAAVAALVVWLVALALRRQLRAPLVRWALLALALAGTFSHLALDYTNSYGIHPFWPFDRSWYFGDAVFIIEPWLWIAAIPPLIFVLRSVAARTALGMLLVVILVAAWRVNMVDQAVAIAMTMGAAAWLVVTRVIRPGWRIPCAFAAWLGLETVFFLSSFIARGEVHHAVGRATIRDVVLNPAIGNPLCFRGLIVEVDGAEYRASDVVVAPFPSLRDAASCASTPAFAGGTMTGSVWGVSPRASGQTTPGIRWEREWSAPRRELVALASGNCEIAAALQFVRVPAWRQRRDGAIEFFDLRYGEGGSFASIVTPLRPARCPALLPGWKPPRSDLLGSL